MLKVEGKTIIDAIDIGEVKISLLKATPEGFSGMSMEAKYALIATSTGNRLGAGTRALWSEETNQRLRALLESMELDISEDVFGAGAVPTRDGGAAKNDLHSEVPDEL